MSTKLILLFLDWIALKLVKAEFSIQRVAYRIRKKIELAEKELRRKKRQDWADGELCQKDIRCVLENNHEGIDCIQDHPIDDSGFCRLGAYDYLDDDVEIG